jgi:hypothetical protein
MRKAKCAAAVVMLTVGALLAAGGAYAADGWTVSDDNLPSALVWGAKAGVSVAAGNTGTTTWDGSFLLRSVEGPTATPLAVDRWQTNEVPVVGAVAPGRGYTFDFEITAPPISTLRYAEGVSPTNPTYSGFTAQLDCSWILMHTDSPTSPVVATDMATEGTVIGRFPDVLPGTAGAWAAFWVEELAGRAPLVVAGYPDGTYRPGWQVTRDQMAVYMARALCLPTAPYEGYFRLTDVPASQWAWPWIEALVRAGVVAGYPDGTYRPATAVTRGQMAVYVARGIWGGMDLPAGPSVGRFVDVADPTPGPKYWAYDAIEFAVAHHVVQGYPDGTYRPEKEVTRDQMAVFVWKGFVMPSGAAVVLAGPATCAFDPAKTDYLGWTTTQVDPAYAYVAFDALRLDTDLVTPSGSPDWDVVFDIYRYDSVTQTRGNLVASLLASLSATEMLAAKEAAAASGDPYLVVSVAIPELDPDDYQLVVTAETSAGFAAVARQPLFSVG